MPHDHDGELWIIKKRHVIAHDYVHMMPTNAAKSHNVRCSGPVAADAQNMNSEQSDNLESAQSDGWVVDQNSFSSEESSNSSVASDNETHDEIDRTMRDDYNEYLVYDTKVPPGHWGVSISEAPHPARCSSNKQPCKGI